MDWELNTLYQQSFNLVKQKVSKEICLKGIDYLEGAGGLKLAVDSSSVAAGKFLMKVDPEGLGRTILYNSLVFTPTES